MQLLGIATGCIGLSLQDFERCTPSEFRAIFDAWHERAQSLERSEWEQTRFLCACVLQYGAKKTLDVRNVLPLPWDKTEGQSLTQGLSDTELKARYESAKKRYGFTK